MPHFK